MRALLLSTAIIAACAGAPKDQGWPCVGGDRGCMRYAELDQIHRGNVHELEVAWTWHTGESVTLPFLSVHVLRDGAIAEWRDYWDLQTLLGSAPQWWVDHIMVGWAED